MASDDAFRLHSEEYDGQVRVVPCGELDLYTADAFDAALVRVEESQPRQLVLDLRGLRFVDSTGLRSLLGAARRAKARGDDRLAVVRGPEEVQAVFRICGIEQFFTMVDDPADLTVA